MTTDQVILFTLLFCVFALLIRGRLRYDLVAFVALIAALTLMPLSFTTILGGMTTLIGTPPNIIIAEFRQQSTGTSFSMFDFAPVGLACAVVGVLFVATIGWRLLPARYREQGAAQKLFDVSEYVAELHVSEDSPAVGQRVRDLDALAEKDDVAIVGLVRRGKRLPGQARLSEVRAGDRRQSGLMKIKNPPCQ